MNTKNEGIYKFGVDFSDVVTVFDNLVDKMRKEGKMSDSITGGQRDSESIRLRELAPIKIATRMREIRHYVREYNQHTSDLKKLGYKVVELEDGVSIHNEIHI